MVAFRCSDSSTPFSRAAADRLSTFDLPAYDGGTISAEHGFGTLKRKMFERATALVELELIQAPRQTINPEKAPKPEGLV